MGRRVLLNRPTRPLTATPGAMVKALKAVVSAVFAAVLLAGCAGPSAEQEEHVDVTGRPGLEQVVARYEQMQQRIRDRLDAELGPFAWEQPRPESRSPCGAHDSEGVRMFMAVWTFDGNVPDRDWPRARDIVTTVAAEYGFTTAGMQIATPGHHRTTAADPTLDALFDFRTQVNTLMQVTTGCHPAT
jgi:hypothetical protein